jgi:hypothetical protein
MEFSQSHVLDLTSTEPIKLEIGSKESDERFHGRCVGGATEGRLAAGCGLGYDDEFAEGPEE